MTGLVPTCGACGVRLASSGRCVLCERVAGSSDAVEQARRPFQITFGPPPVAPAPPPPPQTSAGPEPTSRPRSNMGARAGRAVTAGDPVRVASISKLVTAIGVMRLVEAGVLRARERQVGLAVEPCRQLLLQEDLDSLRASRTFAREREQDLADVEGIADVRQRERGVLGGDHMSLPAVEVRALPPERLAPLIGPERAEPDHAEAEVPGGARRSQ